MSIPISEKIKNIKPSGIRKFFDIVSEMKDAISLGVGEPDFETPWHIRDEGIYAFEKGKTFYTSNEGLKPLREEISIYLKRKQNIFAAAIEKKALKKALEDPNSKKEILNILSKIKY